MGGNGKEEMTSDLTIKATLKHNKMVSLDNLKMYRMFHIYFS